MPLKADELVTAMPLRAMAAEYSGSAEANDRLWQFFTDTTDSTPFLREHRDWTEANRWGFGDRAFHSMWLFLLSDLVGTGSRRLDLLEIGVFKGQILSLWALIARELEIDAAITGISPLSGKPPSRRAFHRVRMLLDKGYREDAHVGNLHENSNFASDVVQIFERFELSMDRIKLVKGLSQDAAVIAAVRDNRYHVVYIDGGHRYEEVASDLRWYSPLVRPGGYLVVDDAGYYLPGSVFFKGFESVSRAVSELDSSLWSNVLNVGHNRIFRRAPDR